MSLIKQNEEVDITYSGPYIATASFNRVSSSGAQGPCTQRRSILNHLLRQSLFVLPGNDCATSFHAMLFFLAFLGSDGRDWPSPRILQAWTVLKRIPSSWAVHLIGERLLLKCGLLLFLAISGSGLPSNSPLWNCSYRNSRWFWWKITLPVYLYIRATSRY